ncbi:ABC transporter substrate-binding protein [Paenibacillus sp. PK3_47]|uniref:DUF3502 domain-containing protein n=1 Tax=Paenibacillus sp. PK3_47 TaxID=2072642 RepID=UPI00201E3B5C|nr:DUF3502 domain-containing protein [Paenibacillus sp. PK3_47]UQZ33412.1 ABC transporter substrate-binding protein [Paenibacillus sp. PK3_47]
MQIKKTLLTLISAGLMAGMVLSGCSGNNNNAGGGNNAATGNAQASTNSGADLSKPAKLTGYLLGAAPVGMDAVVDELNKKLKADINAEIEFRYIGWGDLASKYPLVLAAGEDVDFIFSANWAYYNQEASKGAFREITLDEVEKYMPKHFAATNEVAWKEAQVGGKMYMIPTSSPDQKVPVTLIRDDLRKKYGLPEIKRFQDIEPYLEAVKQNEKAMIPINADSQYDFGKYFFNLQWEFGAGTVDSVLITNGWSGTHTDWDDQAGTVYSQFDPYIMEPQKKAAAIVKSWNDKGYINKNAISNKVRSKDAFEQGKSAVAFGNTNDIQTTLAKAEQEGWEVAILPNLSANGTYPMDPYINNGVSIAAGSKNPERAMMALDLIMEEPSYNKLVYYGIEGVNYVEKDGKIDLPEGVTAESNTYAPDAAGFWFTNKSQFPPMANWTEQYIQHKESLKDILVPYVFNSLAMDTVNIKTELANMNTVKTQYYLPIQGGIVKDIDKAFTELEQKAKDAGLDKIVAEAQKQAKEFLANQQ